MNGIANNELITVSQTIVEQGLCALFSNKKQEYLLPSPTGRGWGVGLLVSVPCSPTRSKGIHSPLQRGGVGGGAVGLRALFYREVTGVGLLYIYAILRAFSETHQITV